MSLWDGVAWVEVEPDPGETEQHTLRLLPGDDGWCVSVYCLADDGRWYISPSEALDEVGLFGADGDCVVGRSYPTLAEAQADALIGLRGLLQALTREVQALAREVSALLPVLREASCGTGYATRGACTSCSWSGAVGELAWSAQQQPLCPECGASAGMSL